MAGQIMRGTTGPIVRSTAGMIVRADDLYPEVLQLKWGYDPAEYREAFWLRSRSVTRAAGDPPGTTADWIDSAVWGSLQNPYMGIPAGSTRRDIPTSTDHRQLYISGQRYTSSGSDVYNMLVQQRVHRLLISSMSGWQGYDDLDLGRVASIECDWALLAGNTWITNPVAANFRLSVAFGDDAEEPTVGGSNEPWTDEVWTELGSGSAYAAPSINTVLGSGTFAFPVPATAPSTAAPLKLMLAIHEDGIELPARSSPVVSFAQGARILLGPARIIYNLTP
jgi:hypothetical protein